MRLIDADALINTLKDLEWITDDMENDTASIEDIINNAPTVEQFDDTELQRAIGYSDGYLKGKEDRPTDLLRELKNCRNELCLKCGRYKEAHLGACDGCRWNDENMRKWEENDEE